VALAQDTPVNTKFELPEPLSASVVSVHDPPESESISA
jgi:hypothetical protein